MTNHAGFWSEVFGYKDPLCEVSPPVVVTLFELYLCSPFLMYAFVWWSHCFHIYNYNLHIFYI